jgi:hypothetical protein
VQDTVDVSVSAGKCLNKRCSDIGLFDDLILIPSIGHVDIMI